MLQVTDPLPKRLLFTAAFVLPACLLLIPELGDWIFALLAAAGVVCFIQTARHPAELRPIVLVSLLTLGFFAAALVSAHGAFDDAEALYRVGKSQYFLAAPFIGLLFLRLRLDARLLFASVRFAALLVFLAATVQYLMSGGRAGGAVNPLVFGCLALLLGFFSLVRYPMEAGGTRLVSLLAFCAGCGAAVLSQSRGVWIASLILVPVMFLYWTHAGVLSKRVAHQVGAVFALLVLFAGALPFVQQRAMDGLDEYRACVLTHECRTSVGMRLQMWHGGWRAALQRPLLGWGLHRTQQAAVAELDDVIARRAILGYTHLHNEYLNTLVGKGMVGLFSLLLLLGVPLLVCLRSGVRHPDQLIVAGIGLLLCTGYALAGLSNLAFGHETMNAFFVYFISLVLPRAQTPLWTLEVDSVGEPRSDILRAPSQ
ncbi:MAG: O-antigen ligase family protein [Thiogranum sp.]|nr:O-antigen ligase family protein [Thiogranum sp.]